MYQMPSNLLTPKFPYLWPTDEILLSAHQVPMCTYVMCTVMLSATEVITRSILVITPCFANGFVYTLHIAW